jgi:hypothetical protein
LLLIGNQDFRQQSAALALKTKATLTPCHTQRTLEKFSGFRKLNKRFTLFVSSRIHQFVLTAKIILDYTNK